MGNIVEPIRDRKKIVEIKSLLEDENNLRDLLLVTCGMNFALRISDLLPLKVKDFFENGELKEFFYTIDKKTNKANRLPVTESVRKSMGKYLKKYPGIILNEENYIFFRKNTKRNGMDSISRRQAYSIMTQVTKKVGLCGRFGSHSLRKTWGYQAWKDGVSLAIIMEKLNHANLRETKRYLGITSDEVDKATIGLNL